MIPGIIASELRFASIAPAAGPAKFVAVGQDSITGEAVIMRSEDGISWLARNQPATAIGSSAALFGIATDGSRWVAVGQDGFLDLVVFTSDDGGMFWTQQNAALGSQAQFFSICWTGTRFIAVGQFYNTQFPLVMVSTNGVTWTQKISAFPSTTGSWLDVDGMDGLVIAVGVNAAGTTPWIMTSTDDGDTWSTRTPAPTTNWSANGIALDPTITSPFSVAVGNSTTGVPRICTSPTGVIWTQRTGAPSTGINLYCVAWNGALFVAIGYDFSTETIPKIMTSPDGVTWTARTADPTTGANYEGIVAASDDSVVAVGHDPTFQNPAISYSADGINWTAAFPDPSINAVLWDVAGAIYVDIFSPDLRSGTKALALTTVAPSRLITVASPNLVPAVGSLAFTKPTPARVTNNLKSPSMAALSLTGNVPTRVIA
jgi:hypothetical protein